MRSSRRRQLGALAGGLVGVAVIVVTFYLLDPKVHSGIPALLLLVPITVASAVGGWRVAAGVAVGGAAAYAIAFLPPVGSVRIGLTPDVATFLTFLAVGLTVAFVAGRAVDERGEVERKRAMLFRSVSHDLRTPLHTIQAVASDLLGAEDHDPATRNALLAVVADESRRLDRIVANMLSASRIEAGALAPELLPEHLPALVASTVARLRRTSPVNIEVDADDALPTVLVDAVQIDQALTNLLDNAMRHSPPGRPVRIGLHRAGKRVAITVIDEGPGFDESVRSIGPRPFHHERPSTGVGLGLVVCAGIVEAHGGSLVLTNGPGGGANATFTVPTAERLGVRHASASKLAGDLI